MRNIVSLEGKTRRRDRRRPRHRSRDDQTGKELGANAVAIDLNRDHSDRPTTRPTAS